MSAPIKPMRKLLTAADIADIVPYSGGHINRMIRTGSFPQPVKLGGGIRLWDAAEVADWIDTAFARRK